MAIEDELVTCRACNGMGSINGDRCEECRGRGITRQPHAVMVLDTDEEPEPTTDELDDLSLADLRERAETVGLSSLGDREALLTRLRKGIPDAPTVPEEDAPEDGLDKLTVVQLRERADELGVDSTGKKADLLALIRGAVANPVVTADDAEVPVG